MDQEPQPGGELRIEAYKWLRLAAARFILRLKPAAIFVSMGMTREASLRGIVAQQRSPPTIELLDSESATTRCDTSKYRHCFF